MFFTKKVVKLFFVLFWLCLYGYRYIGGFWLCVILAELDVEK